MNELTRKQFVDIFSVGSRWKLVRCHYPIRSDLDYDRVVFSHKRSKVVLKRISTGEESDLKFLPNQRYFQDGSALEIHTMIADKIGYVRYEPIS